MPPRTASTTIIAASAATAVAVLIATKMFATKSFPTPAILESAEEHKQVLQVLKENLDDLSGDALTKIIRQLDFWVKEKLPESELVALTKRLVHAATWRKRMGEFQVPKVRFGRTEVQMPIITCGSMRFQFTWMSDKSPDVISKKNVVNTTSQENVLDIVRGCLRMGINHFETARNYGTSEIQLVHALSTLIKRGEIKRSDFILQTKTPVRTRESFKQFFEESWEHVKELGYIDLFSFWIITNENQVELALSDAEDGIMAMALEWKKKGMIKHIGFSTHGAATTILKVINSNKFDYINLHNHYFGDYHGEGTPDTQGGHGNLACVKRALELDMGVFNISPLDKGGRLYQPSSQVARTIGPELTPIAYACLHSWLKDGMHTVSVGLARAEDLTEVLEAAEMFANKDKTMPILEGAISRLDKLAEEKLGKDWFEKGLLNLPLAAEKKTNGIGLGHTLWCYNMLTAFGMYDAAKARFNMLSAETKKWDKEKPFEESHANMPVGNPMRSYDGSIDLVEVMKEHYDPSLAAQRIVEVGEVLDGERMSLSERAERGWDEAYDLRPWHEFPDTERSNPKGLKWQNYTRGWLGTGGGPTAQTIAYGKFLRSTISKKA